MGFTIMENFIDFDFCNRCAYKAAYKALHIVKDELADITDPETWELLDELLCRVIKQGDIKISRETLRDA